VVLTVPAHKVRAGHLGLVLALCFLLRPGRGRSRRPSPLDLLLAAAGAASMVYLLWDFDAFVERSSRPNAWDLALGLVAMACVLEAGRRTAGLVLPLLATLALAYALLGPLLPAPWTHRGYGLRRLVGLQYMGLEGLFGTPLAVSASFIILFTLYGALLDHSGAGRFFVDVSMALVGRRRSGPGHAVTLASFLLGGPSGSGVATALTLGSVAYPVLARAGYSREAAGALLSAGGIGAVLSPPVMGAASFLIAEITRVSYLQVLRWALVPTVLYYLSILLVIERDARGLVPAAPPEARPALGPRLRRGWFHFTSVVAIVALLALGFTAERAVLLCMVLAVALSFLDRGHALVPPRLLSALEQGARSVLSVAATCAVAGLLVGVVNLTGLGLKLSGILIDLAGGNLLLSLVYTAGVILVLGLALPITASYVVAAVVTAPALVRLGVPEPAAHMFIFYYAILSEVSPPTALSCLAVSTITGGNPQRTMLLAWRYTLPAFLVPFLFAAPGGMALLLVGGPGEIALALASAVAGMAALALAVSSSAGRPLPVPARLTVATGGLLLAYPSVRADVAGLALLAGAWLLSRAGPRRSVLS
jgi:TRAP transporter 4TM/12TM fusion protein